MIRPNKIIAVVLILFNIQVIAQIDVEKMLVSKIDIFEQHTLWDGNKVKLMGYTELIGAPINLPSPTLVFYEGDSVRLDMWNLSQGPPHTIHLHGLDVDQANDGAPMLSEEIMHDDTGSYYFKAPHPGTYIYHCHVLSPIHVQAGMYGLIIIKPSDGSNQTWSNGFTYDSEEIIMTSELDTNWHHDSIVTTIDLPYTQPILNYSPQYFLINGKSETQLTTSESSFEHAVNEKVYLRLANIGNYGNRIIFPAGLNALAVSSDGRPLPITNYSDTIDVLPGERFGVLIEADNEFTDSINIEFFNLNTEVLQNTQYVPVIIEGAQSSYSNSLDINSLNIFPNPSTGSSMIEFIANSDQEATIMVRDIHGHIVYNELSLCKKGINNKQINISPISSGIYFLTLNINQENISKKIIINQ